MPIYDYTCEMCGLQLVMKPMREAGNEEPCMYCGRPLVREFGSIAITGDRDSFGVGRSFYDKKTGQEIDTWRKWEKAGFKQAQDGENMPSGVKNEIKDKIKREKGKSTNPNSKIFDYL